MYREVVLSLPSGTWPRGGRPWVDASEQDLPRISAKVLAALAAANQPPFLFVHAGAPVWVERQVESRAPQLRRLTTLEMRWLLARVVRLYKRPRNAEIRAFISGQDPATLPWREHIVVPPQAVIQDLLVAPGLPFPLLERLIEVPSFAPDGTLMDGWGYHPAGRAFLTPSPDLDLPSIPDAPTEADVAQARALIGELLWDFPFVAAADRAHAIALLLLPLARDFVNGPTPIHFFSAATAGTGKGLLASMLLRISTGNRVGVMAAADTDAEWRRRITAKLRDAPPAVLIDNVVHRLDSGALAAALTATIWEDRLLGQSRMLIIPVRCVWAASGNNVEVSTELARRLVRIRLVANVEKPHLNSDFRHNLPDWAEQNRGRLLWAGLVLVRRWLSAGRPPFTERRLGSFESWGRVIGGILDVAGIDGFLANIDEFESEADLDLAALRMFVELWWSQFEGRPVRRASCFH